MENVTFEEKINTIKSWLGTGSINIFGLPMSGKDTQGLRLAEALRRHLAAGRAELYQQEAYLLFLFRADVE